METYLKERLSTFTNRQDGNEDCSSITFRRWSTIWRNRTRDLAGCFSAGDSIDDALESVKEAIDFHLEGLLEEGQDFPVFLPIKVHQNNAEYAGGIWAIVDVDT